MAENDGTLEPEAPAGSSRDAAVIEELKSRDLAGTVSTLEATVAEHATAAEAWQTERAGWDAERSEWGRERALLSAGITTSEGQAVARALYHLAPEDKRPPLGDWLASATEAPPPALAPYLRPTQSSARAPANGAPAPAPPPGVPTAPKGESTPEDRHHLTAELLRARGSRRDALSAQLAKMLDGR
jgi:hypothetical protein